MHVLNGIENRSYRQGNHFKFIMDYERMFSIDWNYIDTCERNYFSIHVRFIITAKSRSWHKQVLKCLSRLPNYLFAPHNFDGFITIPSSNREGLGRQAIMRNLSFKFAFHRGKSNLF